jgi:hypothetical protein
LENTIALCGPLAENGKMIALEMVSFPTTDNEEMAIDRDDNQATDVLFLFASRSIYLSPSSR